MKTFTNLAALAASAAIANAQLVVIGGQTRCSLPNGSYCAGGLLVRCDGIYPRPAVNCNDELIGAVPVGNDGRATCWQEDANTGNAACQKNCIVYASPERFPLTPGECEPYFPTTAANTATTTTTAVTTTAATTTTTAANTDTTTTAATDTNTDTNTAAPTNTDTNTDTNTAAPTNTDTNTQAPTNTNTGTNTNAAPTTAPTNSASATGRPTKTWDHHHWTKSHGVWPDWTTKPSASASASRSASASASAAPTRGPRPGPWTKKPNKKPDHHKTKWETSECETETATAAPVTVLPTKVPAPPAPAPNPPAPAPAPNPPVVVVTPPDQEISGASPVGGNSPAPPVVTAGAEKVKAATAGLMVVGGIAVFFL